MNNLDIDCVQKVFNYCHDHSIRTIVCFSEVNKAMNSVAKVHLAEIKDLYEKIFALRDNILIFNKSSPLEMGAIRALHPEIEIYKSIIRGSFAISDQVDINKHKPPHLELIRNDFYPQKLNSVILVKPYDFEIDSSFDRKQFKINFVKNHVKDEQHLVNLVHATEFCNKKLREPPKEPPKEEPKSNCSIQ
jgi:hypothetical protein